MVIMVRLGRGRPEPGGGHISRGRGGFRRHAVALGPASRVTRAARLGPAGNAPAAEHRLLFCVRKCWLLRSLGSSAGLTGRAPEGGPVLLSFGADRRAAAAARAAVPSVHPVLLAAAPVPGRYVAMPLLVRVEQPPGQVG